MKKLDYIDALRGLAILGVIMGHSMTQSDNSKIPSIIGNIIHEGARGVQLFYLASAFTLLLSFKYRSTKENSPIRNFFLRRFFRIAPMYYLGIIYYLLQDGLGPRYWLGNETHITIPNILSNFTFLHGFNPYWINSVVPGGWSIAVEMAFYAIFPFLFLKIKNLNQAFNFFAISIVFKLFLHLFFMKFQLISDKSLWDEYLILYFPSQLPVFCLGMILYYMIIEKESIRTISGKSILLFSGLILVQLATNIHFFSHHILFGGGFLLLGYALSRFQFGLIVNPILNYIGKVSYSMYLVHFAVLYWLTYFNFSDYFENGILNYITRFFIVTCLTIFASSVFYKIIEVPFQDIGKKIIGRLEKNTDA